MTEENWPSLMEYAQFKKISLSTLRRYIKSNRVKFKLENGRYYIYSPHFKSVQKSETTELTVEAKLLELSLENEQLKRELIKAKSELDEAKMLIEIYENEKIVRGDLPPELPIEMK